jgi:hypothetical protein
VRPTTRLAVPTAVVLLEAGLHSEAQDRRGAALERRFQELDTNGDGKLSREELGDAQQHASWDRDQDGFVTPADALEFMSSIRRARSLLANAPAATGCWMDLPYGRRDADQPPWTGPQLLVKDSANAAWRVDVSWPMARRVTAILSARFVTDGEGKALDPPVSEGGSSRGGANGTQLRIDRKNSLFAVLFLLERGTRARTPFPQG